MSALTPAVCSGGQPGTAFLVREYCWEHSFLGLAGPQAHSLPGILQGQALTESPEYEPGQRLGQCLRDHKARPGESGDSC